MDGLLSLLLFAAFFYLMMRFGCGAHMVHGHGGHGGHETGSDAASGSARDPVCGMEVRAGEGYAKIQGGHQFRFCSRTCLDQFEAEPGRYAA
jgi:YHS domain-containing protein